MVEASKSNFHGGMNGIVACMALVCRVIDLISKCGSTCGVTLPTGAMDTYAALVLGYVTNEEDSGGSGTAMTRSGR